MLKILTKFDPRISGELKKQRRTIIKGLLCAAFTSLLSSLAIILLLREAVKAIEVAGDNDRGDLNRLALLCGLVVIVFGVKYFFTRGQFYYISKASVLLVNSLRLRLFDKLQRLPVSYFNKKRAGAIQSVLINDVGVYQNAVMVVRDSIDGPLRATFALATILYMQWQLALMAALFIPVMATIIQRNGRKMKQATTEVQRDYSDLLAMTQEALQGSRIIKAFGAEGKINQTYGLHVDATFRSQMKANRLIATLRPLVELLGACALAAVLYFCGVLAVRGELLVADLIALTYALDVVNQGVRSIGYANSTYKQLEAATDRIYAEILDVPLEQHEDPQARVLANPMGRVEFRNVSFVYPDGTAALTNVSFVIEPGTSLALVGPSGAGKSTIADLMLRFYDPTEGEILFDGTDIRELNTSWLRQQIGVVPQQTFLFAGSVAENIRLGAPQATVEELEEAARAAHADGFITAMPNRYDTYLGEHGVGLSGGEKQRVAIARAIVRKPTMLLLDEATSNLDAESEKAVQEALEEIMKERTTLFIAHRLTTAARADKILMLRRGEIIESGSHRELMAQAGAYAAMYRAFSSGVLDEGIG